MSPIICIKKNLHNILITFGIFLMLFSVCLALRWKISQKGMLKEYERNIKENVLSIEGLDIAYLKQRKINEPLYEFKKNIQQKGETEKLITNRKDYRSGMMVIDIPKLEVRAAVVEGTTKGFLKKGPGLYEKSPLPSEERGNVCIAGHRTTYGAWFRHVDDLIEGDPIVLEFNGNKYIYKVEKVFIIKKNDWSVTESTGYSALTLTACHPLHSSKQRIVVRAKLNKIEEIEQVENKDVE